MKSVDFLYKVAESYHDLSQMVKISYIRKLKNGKFRVVSRTGKNLGTYTSKEAAKKRLRQVEYFKHLKKSASENKLDLSKIEKFTYSAIMRKINQQLGKDACLNFAKVYKKIFDKNLMQKEKELEDKTLSRTLGIFNKKYKIVLEKPIKTASYRIGDAETVAKYLANIIKFTLTKISPEKRGGSLSKVKNKISKIDPKQLSEKKMPASSAMGQSITFLKHSLFGQDIQYIKSVLTYLMRNL